MTPEETGPRTAADEGPDTAPGGPARVALVTGGAQGIGLGVAEELLARGWHVHVNVRSASKRDAAAGTFGEGRVHGGDLVSRDAADALVEAVLAAEGRLDAVVHAVGPYRTARLSETSVDDFRAMYEGNVVTSLQVVEAARAALRESRGAYVFFGVAGMERWRAREVTSAYVAAKAALLVAVRALALEEAPHGVRANMISPGFVPHAEAAPDTVADDLHRKIPVGRPARMSEVAGAAAWLLSEEARHTVGQNLEIAGGWML